MAIRLTPKQQKASFSAFDTSTSAGEGFQAFSREAGRAAETLSNYATSMEQKRKKAQTVLARQADAERASVFASTNQAYKDALKSGNNPSINEAYAELEEVSKRPLSSYLSEDSGGELSDTSVTASFDAAFKKQSASVLASGSSARDQQVLVNNAAKAGDDYQLKIVTAINDSQGNGTSLDVFNNILNDDFVLNEESGVIGIAGGLTKEGSDTFIALSKNNILGFIKEDLLNTKDPKLLEEKQDRANEFIRNNPLLNFDVDDVSNLEDAYDEAYETANDPENFKNWANGQAKDAILSVEALAREPAPDPAEARRKHVELSALYKDIEGTLTESQKERMLSSIAIAELHMPAFDDTVAPFTPEYAARMASQPTRFQTILLDVLESPNLTEASSVEALQAREDLVGLGLDKTGFSLLRDTLNSAVTDINSALQSGDSSFIRRLSPLYNSLYEDAQNGDNLAKQKLSLEYAKFAKENSTLLGLQVPDSYFIPQRTPIPEGASASETTEYIGKDIENNGAEASNVYAATQLNTTGLNAQEHAYARLLYAQSDLQSRVNAGEQVSPQAFESVKAASGFLADADKADKATKDAVDAVIDDQSTPMGRYITGTMLSGSKETAQALRLFLYGAVHQAANAPVNGLDTTDKEAVAAYLMNSVEQKHLIPLFGYANFTDSSATVVLPAKYTSDVDYTLDRMQRGEGVGFLETTFSGPLSRAIISPIRRARKNIVPADMATDYYTYSFIGALTSKFDLDVIKDATKDLITPPPFVTTVGVQTPAGTRLRPEKFDPSDTSPKAEFSRRQDFTEAFMRGFYENTVEVSEGVEVPLGRISPPVWEQNAQGKYEQRVYLEMYDKSQRGYIRISHEGAPVFATLGEIDPIYNKAIKMETSRFAAIVEAEETISRGFGVNDARRNTINKIVAQQEGFREEGAFFSRLAKQERKGKPRRKQK